MRRRRRGLARLANFSISFLAHVLCIVLLVALPTCGRRSRTEHKIYTFELVDPSLLTMKKPARRKPEAPARKKPVKKKRKKKKKKKSRKRKRVIKKSFSLPKTKKVEERIKEKLAKLDRKEWLEPSKLDKLDKAKLLDTGTFTNSWYNDVVASKIYQCWKTPSRALAEAAEKAVVIRFRILRGGEAKIMGVERGSGNDMLDRSAVRAIEEAQPFPPLPKDFKGDYLEVCMTFIPEE